MFRKENNTKIHFIGIGGIGMSGIAHVLLQQGYQVSGSDIKEGSTTQQLRKSGADIYIGHHEKNVELASVVVYSSAVNIENPEMVASQKRGLPLIRRAEMLAELMRLKYGIAIAGTHGKTTTTSFLATILHECKIDPTHIIGGIVENLGGHARVGTGNVLVAEADESDGSFLLLSPIMSVITNIDDDHLDYYKTKKRLIKAFTEFANRIPFYGCCALNVHDESLREVKKNLKRPWVNFGIWEERPDHKEVIDYEAREIVYKGHEAHYKLYYKGTFATDVRLLIPGRHNILNSLGAIAIAHKMDLDFISIAKSLEKFKGAGRRFETLYKEKNFHIIDDYAHHPTEVSNTLVAAKQLGYSKLVVLFEPHRYSRTQQCWKDFLHCFNKADEIFIGPIYAASEHEIPGVTGERLVQDINELHPGFATSLDSIDHIEKLFKKYIEDGTSTLFMTLGAGSIGRKVREAVSQLRKGKT